MRSNKNLSYNFSFLEIEKPFVYWLYFKNNIKILLYEIVRKCDL